MKHFSHGMLAVMVGVCALAAMAFSGPVQARDNGRDRGDTRAYQQNNHDRGRHNGYAYGQSNRNYRGNGYYQRNGAAPFAYVGEADRARYGSAYRNRRHNRRRRHH